MNSILRFAATIMVLLCSLSTFAHQFLPTESTFTVTSEQSIKLTTQLDLIEMIQQVLGLQVQSGGGFFGVPSSTENDPLIEDVRQLPEAKIRRALDQIQNQLLSRIEMQVDGRVIPMSVNPLPSAGFIKEFLAQPPQYTEYRIPVHSHAALQKGDVSIKIRFPSEFGNVKLKIPNSPSMLVSPSNFSLPINVSSHVAQDNAPPQQTEASPTSDVDETAEIKKAEQSAANPIEALSTSDVDEKSEAIKAEQSLASPSETNVSVSVVPTFLSQVVTYLYQGVLHIVPKGLDHILFVLALFLLSIHIKPLLLQVTVFTLAHTNHLIVGRLSGHSGSC